jgi:hypothetical protein
MPTPAITRPRHARAPARSWLFVLAALLSACRSERATRDDCAAILERIVALELAEQGFIDPELTRRKQSEFARLFAADLQRCEGLSLPPGARDCVARATSAEQVSHECLR